VTAAGQPIRQDGLAVPWSAAMTGLDTQLSLTPSSESESFVSRARPSTKAPKIDDLVFGRLSDGDPAELTKNADLESVLYADLALPRLELAGAVIASCRFVGLAAEEIDLSGARVSEIELERVNLPVVRAARSEWRGVTIGGRLGSLEAYDSRWRSAHFSGCKLSFVNFRGAELIDVAFTDCLIEELDLLDAAVHRVSLTGTRVAHLNVQHSDLHDFDLRAATLESIDGLMSLRGTTITPAQLSLLAPLLADEMGLRVEP
jgi:uncharacterized protein YjbI with pentapeptide repeats